MHRTTITALTLAAVMAAASFATPASAATQFATAAAKPNLRACYDGKCKITITRPVSFRVAARYRLSRVWVSKVYAFNQDMVRVEGPGVATTLGAGGSGSINSLNVRVLSITDRGATVRFEG
ncbi:hypothetical protein [Nonomuraea endophytica]|uniref:Uncharacterized protein n=1 Tax=Nonomuraea endophytica TaxID=714136 RepID=A0A7W8A0Y3_9ACTN|nr:hypothetical protein [Nonomuraea endophytica]MBB5076731.1 hypothetical protein [Nonomuraea endophytica]